MRFFAMVLVTVAACCSSTLGLAEERYVEERGIDERDVDGLGTEEPEKNGHGPEYAGIALTVLSMGHALLGVNLLYYAASANNGCHRECAPRLEAALVSYQSLIQSGILALVGIPLWAAGSSRAAAAEAVALRVGASSIYFEGRF
jgi:hypothetical protein